MSNEEIVAAIRAGDACMEDLWEQVKGLVKWKARHIMTALEGCGSCGVEFDDLYQSGYLAMVAAVDSYNPENCKFSTWFMYYLKKVFAETTGFRTEAGKNEPLNNAVSLSQPIGKDEDDGTLENIVPDPKGEAVIDSIEERIWHEQLHETMECVLEEIPVEQREILRHRYYMGHTLVDTAQKVGITSGDVRRIEEHGLKTLRRAKYAKRLRPFFDFDYFGGASMGAFKHSGMSIQERYLVYEENQAERERKLNNS